MVQHDTPSTPERTAALIAAMMLRFVEQDIKGMISDPDGEPPYVILPDGPRLRDSDLVDWLERAAKPLFAVPIYRRRMIAAWPAFSGSQLTHDLANQQNAITSFQQKEQLVDSATITLDTGTEMLSFPLSHLKTWAANYVTSVGWDLKPPSDDTPARLLLIIPGRRRSPGWGTPGDPHGGTV